MPVQLSSFRNAVPSTQRMKRFFSSDPTVHSENVTPFTSNVVDVPLTSTYTADAFDALPDVHSVNKVVAVVDMIERVEDAPMLIQRVAAFCLLVS